MNNKPSVQLRAPCASVVQMGFTQGAQRNKDATINDKRQTIKPLCNSVLPVPAWFKWVSRKARRESKDAAEAMNNKPSVQLRALHTSVVQMGLPKKTKN